MNDVLRALRERPGRRLGFDTTLLDLILTCPFQTSPDPSGTRLSFGLRETTHTKSSVGHSLLGLGHRDRRGLHLRALSTILNRDCQRNWSCRQSDRFSTMTVVLPQMAQEPELISLTLWGARLTLQRARLSFGRAKQAQLKSGEVGR